MKIILAGFLSGCLGQVWAAASIDHGDILIERTAATRNDINRMRVLIKKEFGLQAGALKDGASMLEQIKLQTKLLGESADAIKALQNTGLNKLRFIDGFLGMILGFQILGLCLLKKYFLIKECKRPNVDAGDGMETSAFQSESDSKIGAAPLGGADEVSPTFSDNNGVSNLLASPKIALNKNSIPPGDLPAKNSPSVINDPSHSILLIMSRIKSIKVQGLEKINTPKFQKSPPPLRPIKKPVAIIEKRRAYTKPPQAN